MKKGNSNRIIILGDYSGVGTGKHDWTRAFSRKGIIPTELAKQYKVTWCIVRRWKRKSISSVASERTTDKIVTDTEL